MQNFYDIITVKCTGTWFDGIFILFYTQVTELYRYLLYLQIYSGNGTGLY